MISNQIFNQWEYKESSKGKMNEGCPSLNAKFNLGKNISPCIQMKYIFLNKKFED